MKNTFPVLLVGLSASLADCAGSSAGSSNGTIGNPNDGGPRGIVDAAIDSGLGESNSGDSASGGPIDGAGGLIDGAIGGPQNDSNAGAAPCSGTYILCDDFTGSSIDTSKWTVGDVDIAHRYPVRPENVQLRTTTDDDGKTISVVDAAIFGDLHMGAMRQGGLLITAAQYGGGRYESRMRNLAGPNGCSCMWNYYDSLNEPSPPPVRVYTEIDIEMPAHLAAPTPWNQWERTLGFNTWSHTDSDADATYINHQSTTVNPFDGKFHVFRWDWYDGNNGALKIDWYADDVLQASTSLHVSNHPAQLWVGNWPAPWNGMDYNFDTAHIYIDWVRISAL